MPKEALVGLGILLVIWQALASAGMLPAYLTSPTIIVREFATLARSGELF